jgi:hypothetical protein
MSGAGQFPAGSGPAGGAPITAGSLLAPRNPPAAIYLDGASKDALVDPDGFWVEMDPIDQQVVTTFTTPKGALKHAPEIGHEFMSLPRKTGTALDNELRARAARAEPFATLLSKGTVVLDAVYITRQKTGETNIVIQYRNMRKDPNRVRDLTVKS